MRSMKIVLSSILLFAFASLAVAQAPAVTPGTAVDAKASKATVYVYRYKQFVGAALEPSVYCDDVQLARMSNGRYFTVKVDAENTHFTLTTSSRALNWTQRPDRNTSSG